MSEKLYVFDTSSLIRAWHEAYPPDVVETFWKRLETDIDRDLILAPEEVLVETSKRSVELHKWLKGRSDKLIVPIDDDLQDAVTELLSVHPKMAMNRKGASSADAWVVALAKIRDATVISEETMTDSQKRPKIPGVCKDNQIPCMSLLEFMRARKWKV